MFHMLNEEQICWFAEQILKFCYRVFHLNRVLFLVVLTVSVYVNVDPVLKYLNKNVMNFNTLTP